MNADESQPGTSDDADLQQPGSNVDADDQSNVDADDQEGPGWMPAILAATLLMGMVGFIACGFTTWLLFQKRTELVLRTVESTYIPEIEQSRLQPDEKREVVKLLQGFADELERGDHENWQSAAVMQRLVRLPVIQWGELRVIQAHLERTDSDSAKEGLKQLSRLRRAIQLGTVTSIDVEDVLKPVFEVDDSTFGRSLVDPLPQGQVDDAVNRAKLLADRSDVPDKVFTDVRLAEIVKREIETGLAEGGY